jgi:hypothetical protein
MTATHEPLVPDGWELSSSRVATLWLNGKPLRLKPPTIGEFRKITEAVDTAADEVDAAVRAMTSKLDEVRAAVEAGTTTDESIRELNRLYGKQQRDTVREAWWDLLRGIIATLGDTDLPPEEEWPVWLTDDAVSQVSALISHWKTAPPARGGR